MTIYGTLADDYYISLNLNTEMPVPTGRDTVVEFLERVQKTYPSMQHFYTRDNGDMVLEEDKESGHQRWLTLEPRRVCSCYVNPPNPDDAFEQHMLVLGLVPYMLSLRPLDCESLDYMMGFDYSYRGNHDELVAEVLGTGGALESISEVPGARVLNFEPSMTISLDESCRLQARLMIETRTNTYQVRRGDFPEDQISVYFTCRQYGSLPPGVSFEDTLTTLRHKCEELLHEVVIGTVLRPLQQAIAAR